MRSLRWGIEDVATAMRVGSVGQRAMLEGEKVTQALEWGARFCVPMDLRFGLGLRSNS